MKTFKKILAFILAMSMTVGMLTVTALGAVTWTSISGSSTGETGTSMFKTLYNATSGEYYFKLTGNVWTLVTYEWSKGLVIPEGVTVHIDINGKRFYSGGNRAHITNHGTLYITNSAAKAPEAGEIVNVSGANAATIFNDGELYIENTLICQNTSSSGPNTSDGGCVTTGKGAIENNGSLTLNNCVIGGKITGTGTVTDLKGSYFIEDVSDICPSDNFCVDYTYEKYSFIQKKIVGPGAEVTENGTTSFFKTAAEAKTFLQSVSGTFSYTIYEDVEEDPLTWADVAATVEQDGTTMYFSSLPNAVSKANQLTVGGTSSDRIEATIVIQKDCNLTTKMNFYVSAYDEINYRLINFDLNGKTITYTTSVAQLFYINTKGFMNIYDSSEDGTGTVCCPSGLTTALFYTSGWATQRYDIYGGTFTGSSVISNTKYQSKRYTSIHGGTFSTDVTDYLDPGYYAKPNDATNPTLWTVTPIANIASVTINDETQNYESINAAFTAANVAGQTASIKVLSDALWDEEVSIVADKITLDLDGHEVTLASGEDRFATVGADSEIEIISSTAGGKLLGKTASVSGTFVVNGTLSVADGITYNGGISKSDGATVNGTFLIETTIGNETGLFNNLDKSISALLASTQGEITGTLKLLADITGTKRICFFSSFSEEYGRNIIIDLNGHTITFTALEADYNYCFIPDKKGRIVITDTSTAQTGAVVNATPDDENARIIQQANSPTQGKCQILAGKFTGFVKASENSFTEVRGGTFDFYPISNIPSGYIAKPNDPESPTLWTVGEETFELKGLNATVGDCANFFLYVDCFSEENPIMQYTIAGETKTAELTVDGSDKYYVITGIPFNRIGDDLNIKFMAGEKEVTLEKEFPASVAAYCNALAVVPEQDSKLLTLLANIVTFGDELQAYSGEGTDITPDNWVGEKKTTTAATGTYTKPYISDADLAKTYKINSANLNVLDKTRITFTVTGADADAYATIQKGDKAAVEYAVGAKKAVLETERMSPLDYDTPFTLKLYAGDDTLVSTFTYSVNIYCTRKAGDDKIGAIANAIYNYGTAAEAYATAE